MNLNSALNDAAKRYKKVVRGSGHIPPQVQARADEIAALYVRESVNKATGEFSMKMINPTVWDHVLDLMSKHKMVASFTFDADDEKQRDRALMFEGANLVHAASLAVAEQEKEAGHMTRSEHLTESMLSAMSVVYEMMMKLHNSKKQNIR